MVHDVSNPLFARSDKNAGDLIQSEAEFNSFSSNNNVNTLQQKLVSEGQSNFCGVGSNDPKCNPASYQIDVGGFMPISTTPNVVSSTVIFTSPRSVEKLQQHFTSGNLNQPKEILLQILDSQKQSMNPAFKLPMLPPKLQQHGIGRNGRKKFGSRLQFNTDRFAHFFGHRRRRDASEDDDDSHIRNVFADKSETVNMIKGFQVVSAADLAFNPATLAQLMDTSQGTSLSGVSEEICFNETSFYAGLLVVCSLLLVSGMLSVCSIRKIRKYQNSSGVKKMFFGDTCSTLEQYHH